VQMLGGFSSVLVKFHLGCKFILSVLIVNNLNV